MELGRVYLKDKRNKILNEVTVYEDGTVKVLSSSFWQFFKKQLRQIKFALFRSLPVRKENIKKDIGQAVIGLVTAANKIREQQGMKPIKLKEFLKTADTNIKKLRPTNNSKSKYKKRDITNYIG